MSLTLTRFIRVSFHDVLSAGHLKRIFVLMDNLVNIIIIIIIIIIMIIIIIIIIRRRRMIIMMMIIIIIIIDYLFN